MDMVAWAKEAEVGEVKVYYTGPVDACRTSSETQSFWTALQAHEAGLVFLSQRRVRHDKIAYRATRISRETAFLLDKISACISATDPARRNPFLKSYAHARPGRA